MKKPGKKNKETVEVNRFKPSSIAYRGCYLFSKFERFHLSEQQRAANDSVHNAFVQKLSSGKKIDLNDIKNYQHLDEKDMEDIEWRYAPILVSTNTERLNIIRYKAYLWAKEFKTYVFKWKCRIGKEQNRPSEHMMENITENNAFFWQFWVHGAPAYLTYNINGDLSLVNGAPLFTNSLLFENSLDLEIIKRSINGPNKLPYGSEIEVNEPASLNMLVQEKFDGKPISDKRRLQLKQLQKLSMSRTRVIIPITRCNKSTQKKFSNANEFSYKTGNPLNPIATAEVFNIFPFDLAFSMTVHKAQGRTIPKVVLDLSCHPTKYTEMNFAAIFVAMSRVKNKDDICLLSHEKKEFYQHCTSLFIHYKTFSK